MAWPPTPFKGENTSHVGCSDRGTSMMFARSVNVTGQSEESSVGRIGNCWESMQILSHNVFVNSISFVESKQSIYESINQWNILTLKYKIKISDIHFFTFPKDSNVSGDLQDLRCLEAKAPGIPSSDAPSAGTSGWPAASASRTTADPAPRTGTPLWPGRRNPGNHLENPWKKHGKIAKKLKSWEKWRKNWWTVDV